ncbi:MAG TPA: phytase [Hyphomonas sp.]|nr:3-phytase [Hyphomonas sp.]HRI99566.1 phytase [Hyphomonas sp.]HRK66478.1 phytase [Hyphomonas sp.]
MRSHTVLASISALLVSACASAPPVLADQRLIPAAMETDPAGARGDAADDPALWLHPDDASKSLILGTNKREGLVVYNLNGKEVQRLPIGLINNVDLRQSADRPYDVAVASNDQVHAISIFLIDRATGEVSHRGDIPTNRTEPYGICSAREGNHDYAGVTYKDGTVEIWAVSASPLEFAGQLVKTMKLGTQIEGCVFDETQGLLFVGEENRGLWKFAYHDEAPAAVLIDEIGSATGLVADVEGVTLWRGKEGKGWLVASAQSANRFIVYDRQAPHAHRGSFSIVANPELGIDEVTHTDGLDIFSGALPGWPRGIVIVQDDGNPQSGVDQNFKVASWAEIEAALNLPQYEAE